MSRCPARQIRLIAMFRSARGPANRSAQWHPVPLLTKCSPRCSTFVDILYAFGRYAPRVEIVLDWCAARRSLESLIAPCHLWCVCGASPPTAHAVTKSSIFKRCSYPDHIAHNEQTGGLFSWQSIPQPLQPWSKSASSSTTSGAAIAGVPAAPAARIARRRPARDQLLG
jgi:hypothetical protein